MHGVVANALIDVHNRADEVHTNLLGGSGAEDVSPELLAFLQRPRIGALIDQMMNWETAPRIWRSLASVAFMDESPTSGSSPMP